MRILKYPFFSPDTAVSVAVNHCITTAYMFISDCKSLKATKHGKATAALGKALRFTTFTSLNNNQNRQFRQKN